MKSPPKMPDFEFTPALAVSNLSMLAAATWKGKPLNEANRNLYPVLHTRGYVNASIGGDPNTDPSPTFPPFNDPVWIEPPKYFGKKSTPVEVPRSLAFNGDAINWNAFVADDPTALNNGGVFRFITSSFYDGFFLRSIPWFSRDLINPPFDYLPIAEDPSRYVAGEHLSIVLLGAGQNYGQDAWSHDVLLPSDISQLVAAKPNFKKLAFRLKGFAGQTGASIAFYDSLVADAVAAGLDVTFVTGAPTLANIRADYTAFFGL